MFKQLFIITLISTINLWGFNQKVNICTENVSLTINDLALKEERSNFERQVKLKLPIYNIDNNNKIMKLAETIIYDKPYDKNIALEFLNRVDTVMNKYSINNSKKNVQDPLLTNGHYWDILDNLAIFNFFPEVKNKLRNKYIFYMKTYPKFKKRYLKYKSYKGYLIFKNLNLVNDIELEKFYKEIRVISKKDLIYKMILDINNGTLNIYEYFGDENKLAKIKEDLVARINQECVSKGQLSRIWLKNDTLNKTELFVYSKVFPDISDLIKKYYFAISTNTNLWELFDFIYSKESKNYKNAELTLTNLYYAEHKPNYLKNLFLEISSKRAKEALLSGDIFESWVKSINVLVELENIEKKEGGLNGNQFNLMKESKEIIKVTSSDLSAHFLNIKDNKTARFINELTDKYTYKIYKRKID